MTRELPNNFPYIVKKQYIGTIVKLWDRPPRQFFDFTRKELIKHVKVATEEHFSQYAHGHFKQRVMYVLRVLLANIAFVDKNSGEY